MKRVLVELSMNNTVAAAELKKYGKVDLISELMNIYILENERINISEIKNIDGVLSVEEDSEGCLLGV